MLESEEFGEWKNQRKNILKNVERRSLCLLFENRIKQKNIGNEVQKFFEKFEQIAAVLDKDSDGVLDEEPWTKFKAK